MGSLRVPYNSSTVLQSTNSAQQREYFAEAELVSHQGDVRQSSTDLPARVILADAFKSRHKKLKLKPMASEAHFYLIFRRGHFHLYLLS